MKPSISYVDSSSKHSDMQEILHPVIIKWVLDTFGSFNEVQKLTIPQILANKSTLVMAPTGSGKTLAAFLGILSELIHYEEQDMLQDQIYALYISPLKALNNDIFKNLEIPLYDIKQISGTKIKSAKRTGDTTTQERQKISRNPPHILITTPESLGLMLAAPKFKEKLRTIKWLIVDEIHSVAENKRGTFLSVCLERLSYYLPSNLTRIGLSATVEPAELIAHYLIGNRDIELAFVDLGGSRELEIEVISPVKNLVQAHYNQIEKGHIDYIKKSLQKHETTLIFSNTRYLSERLSYKLQNIQDYQYRDKIAVHHGSLDKDVRMEVEDKLKKGDMKAVFTSTSLEMGIDIGSIDLTIQLGSPKSVRAMLQRIGRSGHQENLISKGKILVFNRDDLLECVAIAKLTVEGKIDAIEIPEKPIDVLIQMIVGMAVEKRWKIDEAYQLIRLSYSYRNLSKEEFIQILKFAAVPTEDDEIAWRYAHIWLDIENGEFGKRKSARQAYLQNIGTIPDETTIDVLLEGYRNKIGKVSEKFAEKLKTSDIFILGGKSLQFIRTISDKILVRDAPGMIPTIPSWGGERMPRSNEISMEIQLLLTKLETFIVSNKKLDAVSWLIKEYPINKEIANLIYDYGNEQFSLTHLPKLNSIVIETYVEPSGFKNILVLTLFGLKINMTLSQLLATLHSQDMDVNVGVIATDNGFLLRLPPQTTFETSRLFEILENNDLKQILTQSVLDSEIFKNRFRHVVSRSLMILRNWGGGNVSVIQQKKKSYWLQKHLKIDSPIVKEVQDEVFFDMYDLVQTNVIVNKIVNKQIEVSLYPEYDLPSPMTHDILLNHNVDVVTISDKSSLLMNLHHQVLSRLMPNIQIHNVFDRGEISDYFQNKIQKKNSIEEVLLEFSKYPKYLEHLDIEFSRITNLSTDKLDFIKDKSVFLFTDGTYKSIDLLPFYGSISPMEFWNRFDLSDPMIKRAKEISINVDLDEGYQHLIMQYLYYAGPTEIETISNDLKLDIVMAQKSIFELQRQHLVLSGYFINSDKEYILTEDRNAIVSHKYDTKEITDDKFQYFRRKIMYLLEPINTTSLNLEDFLIQYGPTRSPIELVERFSQFNWRDLRNLLTKRIIYFGRFMGGRLVFVHHKEIDDFIRIGRKIHNLTEKQITLLELISLHSGLTMKELTHLLQWNRSEVQEEIKFLEIELFISRIGYDLSMSHGGTSVPRYVALREVQITDESRRNSQINIINRCIEWYGPLSLSELIKLTRIEYNELENLLNTLNLRKLIVNEQLYYTTDQLIEELNSFEQPPDENINILTPLDPYFYLSTGYTYTSQYPRQTKLSILSKGKIQGSVDIRIPDKDTFQILNLQIYSKHKFDFDFIRKVGLKLMDIGKRGFHSYLVSIEEINLKPILNPINHALVSTLVSVGFQQIGDYLVGGIQNIGSYTIKDIIDVKILNLQKLEPERYSSVDDLINKQGIISPLDALNKLSFDMKDKQLHISSALRIGKLHYINGMLISDDLLIIDKNNTLPSNELIKLLDEPITIDELTRILNIKREEVRSQINHYLNKGLIEQVSPYATTPEYRVIKRIKPITRKQLVINYIKYITSKYGPITFIDIFNQIIQYIELSRTEVLVYLSMMIEDKMINSSNVQLTSDSQDLVYFMREQENLLKDPTRQKYFEKWSVIPSDNMLININQSETHIILYYGSPIISLQIKIELDIAIIEEIKFHDITIVDELYDENEAFLILERYLISLGYKQISIKSIENANPSFWLELSN